MKWGRKGVWPKKLVEEVSGQIRERRCLLAMENSIQQATDYKEYCILILGPVTNKPTTLELKPYQSLLSYTISTNYRTRPNMIIL